MGMMRANSEFFRAREYCFAVRCTTMTPAGAGGWGAGAIVRTTRMHLAGAEMHPNNKGLNQALF